MCIGMNESNNRLMILQNAIHVIGMTVAVALDFSIRSSLKIPWIVIILSACMIYILLWLMDFNKKNIITYAIVLLAGVISISLLVWNKVNLLGYVNNLKKWYEVYKHTNKDYQIAYAFAILFLFVALVAILSYLINKNIILWYTVLTIFLMVLIYGMVLEIKVNKATIAILLIFIAQMGIELCNKRYNKKERQINRAVNFYMLPLCFIVGVLAVGLPSDEEPIQWKSVKTVISTVSNTVDDISFYVSTLGNGFSGEYSVSVVGYSDDNDTLGGTVSDSNKTVLTVEPSSGSYARTYLVGNISDEYTSVGWKRSKIDFLTDQEASVDFYEMLYGLYQKRVMPTENELIMHPMNLVITYQKIRTKTIFHPNKMNDLNIQSKKISYNKESSAIVSSRLLKKGFTYQLNYNEINYDNITIKNYLRNISKEDGLGSKYNTNQAFSREDCVKYLKEVSGLSYFDADILNEKLPYLLQERSQIISQYYTKIPKQVPRRVYELAEQITSGYDNDYDKLKAIEAYFSEFIYTKTPTKTKEGEDFVDYFLFEQKKGYCTYFASSMAILARCVGIPTRYVEGFVLDYKTKKGKDFYVNSKDSHAWVEAYIEGFGWVPFEPTPKMQQKGSGTWRKVNNKIALTMPAPTPTPTFGPSGDMSQMEFNIKQEKKQNALYILRLCVTIVVVISALLLCVILLFGYNKRRKYRNATREEKIKYLIEDMLECIKIDGYSIMETETLSDFIKRLGDVYELGAGSFQNIVTIYEGIRYGNKPVLEQELKMMENYHVQLNFYLRKKLGWIKMIQFKINSLVHVI